MDTEQGNIIDKIQEILTDLRPAFVRDGGDIEFVRFVEETGTVEVRMQGMCRGCGMAEFTLKLGVEATLREQLTGVLEVVAVE